MPAEAGRAPLDGVRVVDVTQEVAGPLAGRILAELGADVVHVEPIRGDNGRNTTTGYLGSEGMFHQVCNRSKRSLAVDLRSSRGVEIVRRLAQQSDVLIDGTTPGNLDRLGLGYEPLSALDPRLIYASLTGYGRRGPLGAKRGYDVLVQAYCGVLAPPDARGVPRMLGYLYADTSAPLLLANGVLAALLARHETGRGQYVETSLLQAAVHMLGPALLSVDDDPDMAKWLEAATTPPEPGAERSHRPGDPTTQIFATAEGTSLMLAAWTDPQFRALCVVLDLPDLIDDPGFSTRLQRGLQGENLRDIIAARLLTKPADEWLELLTEAGVPCGAVHKNSLALVREQQLWDNEMLVRLDHPTKGAMTQPGVGVVLEETPMSVSGPAPLLGEHSVEILAELAYERAEIDALVEDGVIARSTGRRAMTDPFRLDDRVALVTGSGSGNGLRVAEVLAECGADVVVSDVDAERAEAAAERLDARWTAFDVGDLDAVRRAAEQVGRVDILVNNAGLPPGAAKKPFIEQTPQEWAPFLDVNLFGVLHCVHSFLPGMQERRWGRIVTVSSGAALVGSNIGMSLYAAGKAAALGFTRALAWEVARYGVTVNAIASGIMENARPTVPDAYVAANQPIRRPGTGRDIGSAVAWLSMEDSWVTGQTIAVDGGIVMVR